MRKKGNVSRHYWFAITLLFIISSIHAQKRRYEGQGAVTEIMMPSQAHTIGHFSLFYESNLINDSVQGLMPHWYRIAFQKDCEFKLNLIPIVESDRYDISLMKIGADQNFCDAVEKGEIATINSVKIDRTWNDSNQTESFRKNLIFTKSIKAQRGDVFFIEVVSLSGKNEGHIIDLTTCDYSYVLKAVKEDLSIATADSSRSKEIKNSFSLQESKNRIRNTLCPVEGKPIKLSSIKFNEKTVNIEQRFSYDGKIYTDEDKIEKRKKDSLQIAQNGYPSDEIKIKTVLSDAYSGKFISTPPIIVDAKTNEKIHPSSLGNGTFEFTLRVKRNYTIICNPAEYLGYSLDFTTGKMEDYSYSDNLLALQLEPVTISKKEPFTSIYFYPNTFATKPASGREITLLIKHLQENPGTTIELHGHTNENHRIEPELIMVNSTSEWRFEGSSWALAEARANAIKELLIKEGISEKRISVKAFGGDKPIYRSASDWSELMKNMRVEVMLE